MHRENFSIAARWLAENAGGRPPFGSFDRQAVIALWNAGELTVTPLTVSDAPDPTRCWIAMPRLPFEPGSGKLGTPLARSRLRRKLGEPQLIETVPGAGYRI